MKSFFLLPTICLMMLLGLNKAQAQCDPDSSFLEFGIYPLADTAVPPFSDTTLGIKDIGCVGQPFNFTFTAVIPDSVDLALIGQQGQVDLVNAIVTGIQNLPPSWSFANNITCNYNNCDFPSPSGTPQSYGCLDLAGTPDVGDVGDHELVFEVKATIIVLGFPVEQNLTLPLDPNDPSQGKYVLRIRDSNDTSCQTVSAQILFENNFEVNNTPNPFVDYTSISVNSKFTGNFDLKVYDIQGQVVRTQNVRINKGQNTLSFDGSELSSGVYFYSIGIGNNIITKRMIKQ